MLVYNVSAASREDEIPMRMADDSLVVSEYRGNNGVASHSTASPDDSQEYQIYQGVMGRPGIDFPVHPSIPATTFSCREIKQSGYYADLDTDCQVFHICDGGRKISFLCPNGTIFRQSHLICDWWFRVDCGKSVELYEESAEQLAADQKYYKEKSDERERKKKLPATSHEEKSIYALDEPYQQTKQTSTERKGERNSKRVMDANFTNMYPGRQGKSLNEGSDRGRQQPQPIERLLKLKPQTVSHATAIINHGRPGRTHHVFAVDKRLLAATTPRQAVRVNPNAVPIVEKEETERQQLAESASFASHRSGRTFDNLQNFNAILNNFEAPSSTTPKYISTPFKTVSRSTPKPFEFGSANLKLKKTEDRLKYIPFSNSPPAYKPTIPPITTYGGPVSTPSPPTTYSSPSPRSPIDDVYFTTVVPDTSSPQVIVSNKMNMTSNNPDVALTLQELDIHKTTLPPLTTANFVPDTRDGLQVPPSSGPSALRSFALYFAGPEDENANQKQLPFVTNNILVIPIRKSSFSQNIHQQVDAILRQNLPSSLPPVQPSPVSLGSSLTPQTKNSYNALFYQDLNARKQLETTTQVYSIPTSTTEALSKATPTQGNDLDISQSRGIVEPDPKTNQVDSKLAQVGPDLRELAQVFTKALSAYLDDPEAFRKVLSEIRPTEPSSSAEKTSLSPIEYPSATQEDDEVLDFSDVTKPPSRKETTEAYRETTTETAETTFITTTPAVEASNYVLPLSNGLNFNISVPDIELAAPYESLDQSQSSYYTPSPGQEGTTNAIAEEINKEFAPSEDLSQPPISSNEALDSYASVYGSVDDSTRPRYGGFQNNSRLNYSPYGSELTSTAAPEQLATTFKPRNRTSMLFKHLKEEQEEKLLVKDVNNLATKAVPLPLLNQPSGRQQGYRVPKVLNQVTTTTVNTPKPQTYQPRSPSTPSYVSTPSQFTRPTQSTDSNAAEINLELSPPYETEPPQGFFVTYTLVNGELQTRKRPEATTEPDHYTTLTTEPTHYVTAASTLQAGFTETYSPHLYSEEVTAAPLITTPPPFVYSTYSTTTEAPKTTSSSKRRGKSEKSLERIMELQETLMFNTTNVSPVEKEQAREMVAETVGNMTMTDMTATTLTKMMELAAKNETYRRLVLLLVNDRSGRNKTVEEARLSLLRALLTPVITPSKQRSTTEATITTRRPSFRKGKNIQVLDEQMRMTTAVRRVTTASPEKVSRRSTTVRPRMVKTTEPVLTTTEKPSTVIGNLGLIRKTIEESKVKEIRVNSLDDAILDSDARAIELLRSLYSLAARWG